MSATLFGPHGRYRIVQLQKRDVGYIIMRPSTCQWIAANRKDVLATNKPEEVFGKLSRDVFTASKDGARQKVGGASNVGGTRGASVSG